jgi:5-methylthioadenosine/S-adenosylhomocysteine deaminase
MMQLEYIYVLLLILLSGWKKMESQSLIIKNATMMDKDLKKLSIRIEDQKIVEISNKVSNIDGDEVINAEGQVLIPGLVNTHTHLAMTLLRGVADDLPLHTWLNDYIFPIEANFNKEHSYAGAMLGCLEMIRSGTTTFNDMYFEMEQVARAVNKTGIRAFLSHGMIDLGDEERRVKEFKQARQLVRKFHNYADGRVQTTFGPHTPYTCSKELLEEVRNDADKYGVLIHIHVSETKKEVQETSKAHGMRPFEYLEDIGFLGPDVIAAHSVWLSDNEIEIIRNRGVKISHNPLSNMKLASGISPVTKLVERGVCVSLGTDGAASNNNLDLFQEIKTTSLLQKVQTLDPSVIPASKVLEMATIEGAKSLGMENEIGSIEVGKKADLLLVDMKAPHLTPFRNPISHLAYSAEGSDVSTVICNGNLLMQEREFLTINEMEVLDMAENAALDLISRS